MTYRYITVDNQRVLEHRFVMEQHLGRKLLSTEHIHHINGNKRDNRIENLMILTSSEHAKLHLEKLPKTKICKICGKEFEPPVNHRGRNTICSHECYLEFRKQQSKLREIKIDQYDIYGNFLKTWDSFHQIERETGLVATNICKNCKGKIKSAYKYIWKYH